MNRIEFTRILSRNITALFFGALLTSCGVGGDVAQTPSNALNGLAPVLRGVAAVGSPIVGGTVNVVCAAGVAKTITINAGDFPQTSPKTAGYWEVPATGLTLPCAVQVSGGSINAAIVSGGTINTVTNTAKYHSLATSFGTVNITPLTDLIVANVVGRSDLDVWFARQAILSTTSITLAGSATITSAGLFGTVDVGDAVSGTGIPPGAVVIAKASSSSLTINLNATASGTSTLLFGVLTPATVAAAGITPTSVDTALAKLRTAFNFTPPPGKTNPITDTDINPITTAFTPTHGNASDDMLVALKTAMTSANVTHADLLLNAAQSIFPAFPALADLTTAFADTVSGGAKPPVSGNINVSGVNSTTGIIATSGDSQVTVTWNPVAGATSYNLYMNTQQGISPRTDPNKSVDLNVKSPFHKLSLANGTPYFFVVTAVNVNGESIASSVVSAIPQVLPVINLTAKPSSLASGAQSLTSTTTSGSATITSAGLFDAVAVGDVVSGPGIPAGAVVSAKADSSSLTINLNATASGTHTLLFGGVQSLLSTTAIGSSTITSAGLFGPVAVGDVVRGTGIPTGAEVTAKASSSSLTISKNATASGTSTLLFGGASNISWTSTNTTSCVSSGGGGTGTDGNFTTPTLTATTTYTVTCTGPDVTVTANQQSLLSIPTSGSPTITSAALFDTVAVGDTVSGTGIPAGSVVTAKASSSSLTISNNATVSPTFTLQFGSVKPITSTTANGSPTITSAALFGPVVIGEAVSGTGIPPGSVVTAKANSSSLTISNNATVSGSTTLSFGSVKSLPSIPTSGSPTITSAGLFGPVVVGEDVSGQGIPVGSKVSNKANSSSLTIDQSATESPTFTLSFVGTPTQRPKTITQSVTVTVAGLAELATFSSVTGGCVRDRPVGSGGLMWEVKTADGGLRDWRNTYTNYDLITLDAKAMQKYDLATGLFSNPTQAEIDDPTNSVGFRNAVNAQGLCGFNDWRLPTIGELQRIVKLGSIPTIGFFFPNTQPPEPVFPNTQPNVYWSTTPVNPLGIITLCDVSIPIPICSAAPVQGNVSPAQGVSFYNGFESSFNRGRSLHVRLVRTVPAGQ